MKPLRLTEEDMENLVAFLETLVGEPVATELRAPPTLP